MYTNFLCKVGCCHNQCGAHSGSPQLINVTFSCRAQTHAETDNSVTISVSPSNTQETRTYSVKIMNQGKKSKYTIQKFSLNYQFTKVPEMNLMYRSYKKCSVILLWCIHPHNGADTERKQGRGESTDASRLVKPTCACCLKIKDVEDLLTQLREKLGQKYTTEQLICWANMFHMEKHKSLDFPPNLPFFLS